MHGGKNFGLKGMKAGTFPTRVVSNTESCDLSRASRSCVSIGSQKHLSKLFETVNAVNVT